MNMPAKPSIRRSNLTKAQLEAIIAELRSALEEAQKQQATFDDLKDSLEESHRKESYLQQQIIDDLKSDLQQQKESQHKFQKELDKIEHLKTELKQAKNAAFQLSEANEKLVREVNTLKKENESIKAQHHGTLDSIPGRPIQKETDKPADFAKNSWLL